MAVLLAMAVLVRLGGAVAVPVVCLIAVAVFRTVAGVAVALGLALAVAVVTAGVASAAPAPAPALVGHLVLLDRAHVQPGEPERRVVEAEGGAGRRVAREGGHRVPPEHARVGAADAGAEAQDVALLDRHAGGEGVQRLRRRDVLGALSHEDPAGAVRAIDLELHGGGVEAAVDLL